MSQASKEAGSSKVAAVRSLGRMRGSTKPHLFECDDGRVYFVKFKDGTRTAINEYVGYSIARFLALPVPESRFVFVSQELIDASDDLRARGIVAGVHHGSLWLENCIELSRTPRDSLIVNSDCFPGLIVLDNLVLNWDRNNGGNNLLQPAASGAYEYKIVDFNEIMAGPRWTIETMGKVKTTSYLVPLFHPIALSVKGSAPFSPWLDRVDAISAEMLERVLLDVPRTWDIQGPETASVSDFILTRRELVGGILQANKSRFHNWE